MYSLITKDNICYYIMFALQELEALEARILILARAAACDREAEIESILSASMPPPLNPQGSSRSGEKRDMDDVYRKAIWLLKERSQQAFCELRALVEKHETMLRVLSAYEKLPRDLHLVLAEMYEQKPDQKEEPNSTDAICRIEKATGWKRRHIYNLRNKALDLILEIYQSKLSAKQIHQLDLTNYKGGALENYVKTYR